MTALQNGYLTLYLEQNKLFVKTVVVKLKEAAELINEGVISKFGPEAVDLYDPTSWKYYLNLSGQYHPTDTLMTVVSIDTLETIEFTRENLQVHTATAAAHTYGTRHYYALVSRYPEQEGLINGILNPVDIDHAIEAENGTILGYRKDLVEPNEVSLIQDLEAYLKSVISRWYNVQFAMSDNLFCAAFFTQLHLFMLPKLLNLRLARVKTPEAHSFHVRMYLASHQGLDRFLPYLTLKQALWLYRNIAYLERNPGKMKTFLLLVERILTERSIPIGEYSVRQLDEFEGYLPKQIARIRTLNSEVNKLYSDFHSLEDLYEKEKPMALGNPEYLETFQARDMRRFQTHSAAVTQTKVLHSSMVDYTNAVPEPFEEVALRQWCYLATHGLYDVAISFKDPKTSETRSLFAKDAFLYLYYITLKSDGYDPVEIPEYLNMQQRIHPKPTVEDLLSVVDTQNYHFRDLAKMILDRQPNIVPIYSVSAFYEHAETLTQEAYWHWFLISGMQDLNERAYVENMVKRLYEDVRMVIDVGFSDFGTWLSKNNLPTYDLDRSEAQSLMEAIFEAGTGLVIDNARQLKNIQKALLDLMSALSSYSLQFTREINTEDIISLNWPAVRFGNQRMSQQDHRYVENGTETFGVAGHSEKIVRVGTELETVPQTKPAETQYSGLVEIDPTTTTALGLESLMAIEAKSPGMECSMSWTGADIALEDKMGLPGYTTFERLPEDFRQKLRHKTF